MSEPIAVSTEDAREPALQQADGKLLHLFSVPFTVNRSVLATVTGLVAQRVARTRSGGEVEVTFLHGVPYSNRAGSVIVRDFRDPNHVSVYEPLARPPGLQEPQDRTIVTSTRIGSRPTQYLIVWRNRTTGDHSITLFDAADPQAAEPVLAHSRLPIVGINVSPSTLAADYYVTVWTVADRDDSSGDERQVTVEAYTWRPSGS